MKLNKINKSDLIAAAILFIVFVIFTLLQWGRWGNPFVDSGRELYLPTLVLQGKVLYKDILNLYGPLSYQLNALLYALFGAKITVLYIAGIINTIIILAAAYLISRTISSPFTSFVCTFTALCVLVFRVAYICTSNYFFPYAYALIYAFSALLLSLLFYIYFYKKENIKYLYLASFFIGISIACKLDYVFFVPVILATLFFDKRVLIKQKLINIALMLLPGAFCWSILFYQGIRFVDIQNIIEFGKSFANAPSVKMFNDLCLGQNITMMNIKMDIKYFLYYLVCCSIFLTISAGITFFLYKVKNLRARIISLLLFIYPFLKFVDYMTIKMNQTFKLYFDFCWASYLILFILFSFLVYEFLKNKKENIKISLDSKIFILITIVGLLATIRTFFLVCIGFVANFSCLFYFMTVIIFFMEILPRILIPDVLKINPDLWKRVVAISFIVMSVMYLYNYQREAKLYTYKLKSIDGIWYVHDDVGDVLDYLVEYINKNVKPTETILMLPEGPLLSFITKVPTSAKHYSLIPHMTESFGEENVLKDLNKDKPDYIFVNNLPNLPYKAGEFGKTYMIKTYKFVEDNYDLLEILPEPGYIYKDRVSKKWNFKIKIYRVKNKQGKED